MSEWDNKNELVGASLSKVPVLGEALATVYRGFQRDLSDYHQQTRMSDFELLMREFAQHSSDRAGTEDDAAWYEERLKDPEVSETLLMKFRAMERAPGRYARLSMAKTFGIYFGNDRPADELYRAVGRFLETATDDMVASAKTLSELVRQFAAQSEVGYVEVRVMGIGGQLNFHVQVQVASGEIVPHMEPTQVPRTLLFRMIAALKNAGIGEDVMGGGAGAMSGGGVIAFSAEGLGHVRLLAGFLVIDRSLEQKILSVLPENDDGLTLLELHTKLDSIAAGGLRYAELREALARLELEEKIQLTDARIVHQTKGTHIETQDG
ncbi:hypothetical protein [Enhygromyxa salina]|nr:hypothetical protein [Enhygromyxa salina]